MTVQKRASKTKDSTAVIPDKSNQNRKKFEAKDMSEEEQLLTCLQYFLRFHGIEKSVASIRELSDISEGEFGFSNAVSALSNLEFSANVGVLSYRKLSRGHCPSIIVFKDGKIGVLVEVTPGKQFRVYQPDLPENFALYERKEFRSLFSKSILLAKSPRQTSEEGQKKIDWFWGSLSQSKWTYTQVLVAAAVSNFLGLSTSIFIMVVYDMVVPNQAIESLVALTIGVLIALAFDFIIKTTRANFIDKAGKKADARMSRLIFDQLMNMNLASKNAKSGALASIVREFESLRDFFTSATLVMLVDLPFVFLFIYIIYLIGGPLAYVPLAAVPIVMITGIFVQPFLARISADSLESGMSKQGVLVETLNGLETIKATGSAGLMKKRFQDATTSQSDLGLRGRMISQFAINSAMSVQQFAQIAVIFYGVFLIQDGTVTMGALIAVVILCGRTLAPLTQLANALTRVNSSRAAYRNINDLMNKPRDRASVDNPLSRPKLNGKIEFKNVSFKYPKAGEVTIKDLSFTVEPGEKVAILGKMGSGKSTIARLLCGLYEPDSGSILIDGVDIRQIDPADIRRNVGFMLQETWLFSGSIKENIQMGFAEYSDEHILNVAKISGVDEFVKGNPSGYDFKVRERGEGLSGGQRQSINLARALLHAPSTLILDEPTSSMDSATEKLVLDNLIEWMGDRTLLAITHRNTLVRLATRVLVVDQGTLVADEPPEKLLGPRPT
ncbi:MAG: type I secretion system permease/ATPase [Pseudomonadota bacterium]|nr:type I secretion system permease/ATPase [Pseudomonadota bacterium]